jgi:hypothetical protein
MSDPSAAAIPADITQRLRDHMRVRRRIAATGASLVALAMLLAWLLLCALADRFAPMQAGTRGLLLALGLAVALLRVARPVYRLLRPHFDVDGAADDMEQRWPQLGQKLTTICSCLPAPPALRGSPAMLQALIDDVRFEFSSLPAVGYWRSVRSRALLVAVMVALIALLMLLPVLGMPRLLARVAAPWAPLTPVTTAELVLLSPQGGEVDVRLGEGVEVSVKARRLGNHPLLLHTSPDGRLWNTTEMKKSSDDLYGGHIAAVEKDQWFYVSGRDARTKALAVRVLRKPTLSELRLLYRFPAYTGKPGLLVRSRDGVIEAPAGTQVELTAVVSEPLQSAVLQFSGRSVAMEASADAKRFRAEIVVQRDERYRLQMQSRRGLAGSGPQTCAIRALPDRAPLVRLIAPPDDTRQKPTDAPTLRYQAIDDYGISSLTAVVQVNQEAPRHLPLNLTRDPRAQEGSLPLDLTAYPLRMGDVVALSIVATDGGGQAAASPTRYIFIAPESQSAAGLERRSSVQLARQLAARLHAGIDAATVALDAMRPDARADGAETRLRQEIAGAADDAAALKQQLLRALSQADRGRHADLLAQLVDQAQQRLSESRRLVDQPPQGPVPQAAAKEALTTASARMRRMRELLERLELADAARWLLVEMRNLETAEAILRETADSPLLAQQAERLRGAVREELQLLRLQPGRDLRGELAKKIEAAGVAAREAALPDYAAAARAWADASAAAMQQMALEQRLAAAAQAESIRPDGDYIRARDLQLAAVAAERVLAQLLAATTPEARATARHSAKVVAAAIQVLQQRPRQMASPTSRPALEPSLAAARAQLQQLGAGLSPQLQPMEASAAAAVRDYAAAERVDQAAPIPAVQAAMAQAKTIDTLADKQQQLHRDLAGERSPVEIAREQGELAARIGCAGTAAPAQRRADTIAALRRAVDRLAMLPQQLAAFEQAAAQAAVANAAAAEMANAGDSAAAIAAVRRVAAEVAAERLAVAREPLSASAVEKLAAGLNNYALPAAVASLQEKLVPLLASLQAAADTPAALPAAAEAVRAAIATVQDDLRLEMAQLLDQDPLYAAQVYAQAAADAMRDSPAELTSALRHQMDAQQSLTQAWQHAIARAASARLTGQPELTAVFAEEPQAGRSLSATAHLAALREWGKLRRQQDTETMAPQRPADPMGYEQMIRVYFEMLGKPPTEADR